MQRDSSKMIEPSLFCTLMTNYYYLHGFNKSGKASIYVLSLKM
jgi:hypothetical protein